MRRLHAVLVLALVASGCSGRDAPDDLPRETQYFGGHQVGNLTFIQPRDVAAIPNTGHESFLAVSADGQTMLTCAHGDFRAPAHMYASTDGGATFRELDAGPTMLPAGDCDVALGPGGEWTFAGKTAVGVTVATTKDQGAAWIISHAAAPPLNGLADREWLAYAGDVLLLSYQPGVQGAGNVFVTRSTDFGATWSQPVDAVPLIPLLPLVTAGDFLVSPDNATIRIPVLRSLAPPDERAVLGLAVSRDAGLTWAEEGAGGVVSSSAYPTGAALTAQGLIAWAYCDGASMRLIVSGDDGATWSAPAAIGAGAAHERPWASPRPDGTVDVVWLSDGTHFGRAPGLAVTRIDPRTPGLVLAQAIVADVAFIEFASIAHDGSGRASVAVVDAPRLMAVPPQAVEAVDGGRLLLVQEALPLAS